MLRTAQAAKKDEFYTQFRDIEIEMNAYLDYNPDVFKDKTILLPCDDPISSNFTKFFQAKFNELGLKRLISTSYEPNGHGKLYILDGDTNGDGKVDFNDLDIQDLEDDGRFQSDEVTKLRDEADIIITNPPFSLFREFLKWILKGGKDYIIIGNMNAITYKEVFPLIMNNKMWMGSTIHSGDREFQVPDEYPLDAAGWRIDEQGRKYIRVKGVRWFTNIEHGRRHEPLMLMTMERNLRYSTCKKIVGRDSYQHYDNYDAIEVPETVSIPSDYDGVMGVPISFLDKYCPEQFEILGITENNGTDAVEALKLPGHPKHDRPYLDGQRMYSRILIRKNANED